MNELSNAARSNGYPCSQDFAGGGSEANGVSPHEVESPNCDSPIDSSDSEDMETVQFLAPHRPKDFPNSMGVNHVGLTQCHGRKSPQVVGQFGGGQGQKSVGI